MFLVSRVRCVPHGDTRPSVTRRANDLAIPKPSIRLLWKGDNNATIDETDNCYALVFLSLVQVQLAQRTVVYRNN